MICFPATLRLLAARATRLTERLQGVIVPGNPDAELVETRLRRWREMFVLEEYPHLFSNRLSLDGLDPESCRPLLGAVRLADHESLPEWVTRFERLVSRCASIENGDVIPVHPLIGPMELPFQEIFIPIVIAQTDQLRERAGRSLHYLSSGALLSFQERLLAVLCSTASFSLGLEFRTFAAQHDPLSMFRFRDGATPPRKLYRRFVAHLLDGGLSAFYEKYPVLARLIVTATDHWADQAAEFCRRLDEDLPALHETFGSDQTGPVSEVRLDLSDPHHCGRSVIATTFASGLKLVYKPRDLGVDRAFYAFIDWLNANGRLVPLRTLKILDRSTHGWVEFVQHTACRDVDGVERYYRRLGEVLCLAYLFGTSDLHLENIIAAGEQPVIVDLETMLHARHHSQDDSADQRASEILQASVLRSGLLPAWTSSAPGKSFDLSGIGAEEAQDTGLVYGYWKDVNTDWMILEYNSSRLQPKANLPVLDGRPVSARNHAIHVARGFEETYRFLIARRHELLANDGPLGGFCGLRLRQVLRSTRAYCILASRLLHPEFLQDGIERSIEMDKLSRPFVPVVPDSQDPDPWPIHVAERDALERLDIPFFSFYSDSDALWADGRMIIAGFFADTGFELLQARVRNLGEDDLARQMSFIRASVHSRFAFVRTADNNLARSEHSTSAIKTPLTPEELIDEAVDIAGAVRRSAVHGGDGSSTWLSLSFDPISERLSLRSMTDNFYDGRIGVALFLSAFEHITGEKTFRDLAASALSSVRKVFEGPVVLDARIVLGGSGVGGHLYALTWIADWLDDHELLELAHGIAQWITPKSIDADQSLDVIGGAAGCILGLLALAGRTHDQETMDRAVRCGDHLLKKRTVTDTGHRSWPVSWAQRPLTGFAHGAAGVAYALLRLYEVTGEARFRECAEEGIAYETAVYSKAAKNWPDFRELPGQLSDSFMVAWCHGSTGIGLARLGGLTALDTPDIRQDIENALHSTVAASLDSVDQMCCGNLGRVDFLIEAAGRLNRPDLLHEAGGRTSAIVRSAKQAGIYRLHAQGQGIPENPSLYQGLSGIGYMLLRAAAPERLPCLLLWE